jgi:hypothetical protein
LSRSFGNGFKILARSYGPQGRQLADICLQPSAPSAIVTRGNRSAALGGLSWSRAVSVRST